MAEKVFLIGVGGTGMRCLEAFVHTCAMGMFDKTEVHMLALDTDEHNGNFKRLRELQNCYRKLNGGKARSDTFFSADLHYYEFCPAYTGQTFAKQTHYGNNDLNGKKMVSDQLIDLFMAPEVREMNLEHGYRAQTQMGSVLMYYAIQRAAYEARKGDKYAPFREFLHLVCGDAKYPVFVFGSVFGGTGASSIPIIPLALERAAEILNFNPVTENNHFGTIVLTNYFNFFVPQGKSGEVVAKSDNFVINSQAALMFYNSDNTVNNTYKRMYLLGRRCASLRDVTAGGKANGVTGGEKQENPSDYIELMAALAAYDFVKECDKDKPFAQTDERFFCIGHNYGDGALDFHLFAQQDEDVFKKKFGILTAASVLNLPLYDFFVNVVNNDSTYPNVAVDGEEMRALKKYFGLFNFSLDDHDRLLDGWLPQIYDSRKSGLLFNSKLFETKTLKEMYDFKLDCELFRGENPPKFSIPVRMAHRYSRTFEAVKRCFSSTLTDKDSNMSDLLARTYATLMRLYFND